ncbi:MAG: M23 family metallopeptidase [Clostridia bacterium]|nr:M23 family metallopeptidase [Clostridia bacterium]
MENNNKKKSLLGFIKKYGYHMMAAALVLTLSLGIVFSSLGGTPAGDNPADTPVVDVPSSSEAIVFALPANDPTVLKEFSSTELMYNETLEQWESHKAVDLTSSDQKVYAVLSGVVTSVESSYEDGTIITITHDNGFVSVYSSLDSEILVEEDDTVTKGQEIAKMSSTSANEQNQGNHLHFELFKDGQKVDPSNYLTLENK